MQQSHLPEDPQKTPECCPGQPALGGIAAWAAGLDQMDPEVLSNLNHAVFLNGKHNTLTGCKLEEVHVVHPFSQVHVEWQTWQMTDNTRRGYIWQLVKLSLSLSYSCTKTAEEIKVKKNPGCILPIEASMILNVLNDCELINPIYCMNKTKFSTLC